MLHRKHYILRSKEDISSTAPLPLLYRSSIALLSLFYRFSIASLSLMLNINSPDFPAPSLHRDESAAGFRQKILPTITYLATGCL